MVGRKESQIERSGFFWFWVLVIGYRLSVIGCGLRSLLRRDDKKEVASCGLWLLD
jgi:hypothetical protein